MERTDNTLPDISPEWNQEQNEISSIRDSLIRTEKGSIANSIQNCKTALECDPVLKNSIRKNLLTGQTDLVNPVYWHRTGTMLTDTDQKNIELRLENCYHLTSEKKIAKAVSILTPQYRQYFVQMLLYSINPLRCT